ncbi:MAG: C1 family peptidase [Gemmatimonadota bacterium]|nr:MAG: C1 family peptidase [Gemmatimonadota bacterium]
MRKLLHTLTLVYLLCVVFISEADGQSVGKGGITPAMIKEMRKSFQLDNATRSAMNALAKNDIKDLALNREALITSDHFFSHKIKSGDITNQKSSGRCWLFAGLNMMRPKIIEKYNLKDFDFSENYLFFWDKLEKANFFLESIIETRKKDIYDREVEWLLQHPCPDGGWWHFVVELVNKYGAVPESAMPETNSSGKTGMMNRLIDRKLRQDAVVLRRMTEEGRNETALRSRKEEMLHEIYRMLAMNLGVPPTEFQWRYETEDDSVSQAITFTPQDFYSDVVGINLDDYICIFSCPSRDFEKLYQIRFDRDMFDKQDFTFINLGIDKLKEYTLASVLDDEPVWFACDVGKEDYVDGGIFAPGIYDYGALYGIDIKLTKEERIVYRESTPNHAMVITGLDMSEDKPVKWLVENSWGDERGKDGYWAMRDEWFDEYVYGTILHKKYVPQRVADILTTEPTVLPPWDPMYAFTR